MPQMLDAIGIRNEILNGTGDTERFIEMAAESAFSIEQPNILLLESTRR